MDRMQCHRDGITRSSFSMPVPFLRVQSSPGVSQPVSTIKYDTLQMALLLTEFTKTARNDIIRVQRTTHIAVTPLYKLYGTFCITTPFSKAVFSVNWLSGHSILNSSINKILLFLKAFHRSSYIKNQLLPLKRIVI